MNSPPRAVCFPTNLRDQMRTLSGAAHARLPGRASGPVRPRQLRLRSRLKPPARRQVPRGAGGRAHALAARPTRSRVPGAAALAANAKLWDLINELTTFELSNAPQWAVNVLLAQGFMRALYFAAVNPAINPHQVLVTPELVQILTGVARNLITQIHVGRAFNMEGAAPRVGVDVARWYGETIGFCDGDALITWTSNLHPWTAYRAFGCKRVRVLTPPADLSAPAAAIASALENGAQSAHRANIALARAREHFDWGLIAGRYRRVIHRLTVRGPGFPNLSPR